MKFVFLLKIQEDVNIKGYALAKARSLQLRELFQGTSIRPVKYVYAQASWCLSMTVWCRYSPVYELCRGERGKRGEEEMEGALQCIDTIPLMPPIACKSRRMRCTCLPASPLILYSHVELRPNLIEKGRDSPLVLSIGNLTGLCRLLKIISFVKVRFSIIANYSSTVLESPKMLLCKQSCFTIKKHLPSWRCHGVNSYSHISIFI